MKKLIAYCGLDCEKCDARTATLNNDNALREKVAKLWSEMNGVEITAEMINCEGCRADGLKTPFCDSLCPIRQCALGKAYEPAVIARRWISARLSVWLLPTTPKRWVTLKISNKSIRYIWRVKQ